MEVELELKKIETISIEQARSILGRKLITARQIEEILKVPALKRSSKKAKLVPFADDLREKKDVILVEGLSLSPLEFYTMVLQTNPSAFDLFDDPWFIKERFFRTGMIEPVWYLLQRRINPFSLGKKYEEAIELLQEGETIPSSVELFYLILVYYLFTHKYLFRGFYPFCSDAPCDNHLLVGFFRKEINGPPNYLDIRGYIDSPQADNIGIVSLKKEAISPNNSCRIEQERKESAES